MGSITLLPPNAVTLKDGHTTTDSLTVAEVFGKRHDDVLRATRKLDCSDEFRARNFAEAVYCRPNPSGGKQIKAPMFEMTKDGFIFLVMGFTGAEAAKRKEAYIKRFNEMESALRQPVEPPRETVTMDKIEAENLKLRLENAEMKLAMLTGKPAPKRRPWKHDELARMVALTRQGMKAVEIGEKLGRSPDSVETKQRELRIKGQL